MQDTMLSLLMLCAIALIGGAFLLWRRKGMSRNVWLMLIAAAVMLADVAIWVVPGPGGASPMEATAGPG
jgi:drug/metabolite transporter superfamily protein YnfA